MHDSLLMLQVINLSYPACIVFTSIHKSSAKARKNKTSIMYFEEKRATCSITWISCRAVSKVSMPRSRKSCLFQSSIVALNEICIIILCGSWQPEGSDCTSWVIDQLFSSNGLNDQVMTDVWQDFFYWMSVGGAWSRNTHGGGGYENLRRNA